MRLIEIELKEEIDKGNGQMHKMHTHTKHRESKIYEFLGHMYIIYRYYRIICIVV